MQATRPARDKKKASRLWLIIHSWLALPLWIFVFFVCLTGTIATVSQEIVWLAKPEVRANRPAADAVPLGYDAVLAAVEKAQPGVAVTYIARPVKSIFALDVGVTYPDGRSRSLFVNPYTGAIQGVGGAFDFRYFMRALHGWLLVPFVGASNWGWYLVSALSIPMLGSLVTGLVVYKKFWRGYLHPRLRLRNGARIFWGDLHRLAGIWSVPFIAIMAVTAGWFLIQQILVDNNVTVSTAGVPPIVAREDVPAEGRAKAPWISLDRAGALVREQFPDLSFDFVSLPANAFSHIVVGGRGAYPLIFETANVNPYNGKIEWTRRVSDRSALELVTESMRPLHTGDFAGLWLKLVYFVFGLLLTMMVFSGMMIWTKRTAQATAKLVRGARTGRALDAAGHVGEAAE
ncbi:PepSY-associated TM helix domain-containing protein [Shinella pollutisoli]|uniref:PepSY-associated TM helix domain-containing protein n=1 Tax=Shinella pollutisoli TaxID=2250594 RepID=A0ABV7DLT4_9HYPH|nr:PepSY-associated TM helix domain-containing protein [Shinella pollutisoli]